MVNVYVVGAALLYLLLVWMIGRFLWFGGGEHDE